MTERCWKKDAGSKLSGGTQSREPHVIMEYFMPTQNSFTFFLVLLVLPRQKLDQLFQHPSSSISQSLAHHTTTCLATPCLTPPKLKKKKDFTKGPKQM